MEPDPIVLTLVVVPGPDDPAAAGFLAGLGTDDRVQVVVCADRASGLAQATGAWVGFTDGDDRPGPGYLTELVGFLTSPAAETATAVATNARPLPGPGTPPQNRWARPERFGAGPEVVRFTERPDCFQWHGESFVVRRADLTGDGPVDLETPIGPALALARVLLGAADPALALLPAAEYHYHRRTLPRSSVDPPIASPDQYDAHFGAIAEVVALAAAVGPVPGWLQRLVLHELATYFWLDQRPNSPLANLTPAEGDRLLGWSRRLLRDVDAATIDATAADGVKADIRAAWHGLTGRLALPDAVTVRRVDERQRLAQLRFHHLGPDPVTAYLVDGRAVEPAFSKRRGVTFFGRALVSETIAWLPVGTEMQVRFGEHVCQVRLRGGPKPKPARTERRGTDLRARLGRLKRALRQRLDAVPTTADQRLLWWADPSRGGRRYAGAWLLIDRDIEAHDNAEHLYRHLAAHHPEINSWFVLDRGSPDWPRLTKEGFRLIEHGSSAHTIALLNCEQLISSQVDSYVVNPPVLQRLGRERRWQYHFLQHGVTMHDLSRWLNPKTMTSLVTTTDAEYEAFIADDGNYVVSPHEAILTGMPRHDELLRKAAAVARDERRLLVFMPTWRRQLVSYVGTGNRLELRPEFWQSGFAAAWFGLINSEAAAAAARAAGLEVVLMAHPNLAPFLDRPSVAGHVRIATYADTDIQDVLARAALVVTDYSSLAFEAALIDRPVLYYQFDRAEFFGGSGYRPGYFDYGRDGFGPVATTLADAERELAALVAAGPDPQEPYASRIAATFTRRDGRACERVVQAILDRRRPWGSWTQA